MASCREITELSGFYRLKVRLDLLLLSEKAKKMSKYLVTIIP